MADTVPVSADSVIEVTGFNSKVVYLTPEQREAFDNFPDPGRGHLSKLAILAALQDGDILIDPYDFRCVNTTSVDVRQGHWCFREKPHEVGEVGVLNPFDRSHIEKHWGKPRLPVNAGIYMNRFGIKLFGICPEDYIIFLAPGETILGHTTEFIGGRNCVSTEMRARSSMGRIGVTVCKCAGWGDLGFVNRWTMEMTNHLTDASVILVVGMRVAQLIFFKVDPVPNQTYATGGGKYQLSDELDEIRRLWKPEMMLPKMERDYELKEGFPLPFDLDKEAANAAS